MHMASGAPRLHHVLYHAHHTAATLLSCMSANRIVPTPTPCASAPRPASLAVAPTVLGSVGPRSEIPLPIHAVTAAKIYGRFPKYGNWLAAPRSPDSKTKQPTVSRARLHPSLMAPHAQLYSMWQRGVHAVLRRRSREVDTVRSM